MAAIFSSLALDVYRLLVWAVVLTLIFVPLEHFFQQRPSKILRKGFGTDVAYYFLSGLLPKWLLLIPVALAAALIQQVVPSSFHAWVADWPFALRFVAMVVVGDIGAYWGHRLMHEKPALWRFHAVHHSATQIDWLVNSRAHPVDMVFVRMCGIVPLHVLGIAQSSGATLDPMTLSYILLGTLWSFFVHANVRWRFGWLEHVIATPAFHHWHHTNDGPAVLDKNYAAIFPWVDRMFGTLYLPADRWPQRYGTDTPVADSLGAQLLDPLSRQPQPERRPG